MKLSHVTFLLLSSLQLPHAAGAADKSPTYVFQMKGTASAEMRPDPANPDDTENLLPCFDIDLYDLDTKDKVGVGTDCLSVVDPDDCDGLQVTATTVFNLDGGSIMLQGLTSVQPTTHTLCIYVNI